MNVDNDIKVGDLLGIDENGKVVKVNKEDRYALGKATKSSINGKVYMLIK